MRLFSLFRRFDLRRPWTSALLVVLLTASATVATAAGYDPKADPAADLEAASAQAKEQGKNILIKVGGEWCSWCHLMDRFIHENKDVESLVEHGFVVLKVNFSEENKNEAFLARFPAISGYPHLFVLDAAGELLHSQDTAELESGKGYAKDAFVKFLQAWSPAGDDSTRP